MVRRTALGLVLVLALSLYCSKAGARALRANNNVPKQNPGVLEDAMNAAASAAQVQVSVQLPCGCAKVAKFVCASNGITYANECLAKCAGAKGPFKPSVCNG